MIYRILTGWTLARAIYLIIGVIIIIHSIMDKQWISAVFGGYFATMALFSFGCAGGNCTGESCSSSKGNVEDIDFGKAEKNNMP